MSSSLVAHSPKFQSKLVTHDQLRALPEPLAIGSRHKPVPHAVLVDSIKEEMGRRELVPVREQYALGAKGNALFGVIDLQSQADESRALSFGFRSSVDSSLSIKAVAGTRVFVCDNLALSGNMIAIQRKSTTGLRLGEALQEGFDKFVEHEEVLTVEIARLQLTAISDNQAKQFIFDVFNAKVVPVRLFEDVSHSYFKPTEATPDTQERTMWGLMNAFTRAMRDLPPVSLFRATQRLGNAFQLTTSSSDVEDSEEAVDGTVEE